MRKLLGFLALLLGAVPAHATTCTYTFVDSSSVTQTVNSFCDGSSHLWPMYVPIDTSGNAVWGTAGSANADVLTVQGIASMTPFLTTGTGTAGSAASGVLTIQGIASMTPVQVTGAAATDPCTALAKTSVSISLTGTTKLVAKTSAKKTYICSLFIVSSDAENWSIVEGTKVSTECDTSTAAIIGSTTAAGGPHFAANGGLTLGSGGYTIAAGANNNFDVCLFQSGSGTTAGVLTYVQN